MFGDAGTQTHRCRVSGKISILVLEREEDSYTAMLWVMKSIPQMRRDPHRLRYEAPIKINQFNGLSAEVGIRSWL
jgi:hypothetical protein